MRAAENSAEHEVLDPEPISPELVLVCPELRLLYEQGWLGSGVPALGPERGTRPTHAGHPRSLPFESARIMPGLPDSRSL